MARGYQLTVSHSPLLMKSTAIGSISMDSGRGDQHLRKYMVLNIRLVPLGDSEHIDIKTFNVFEKKLQGWKSSSGCCNCDERVDC